MGNIRIKGINRKRRKNPREKMQVDNRGIFILEEVKKKKREKLIRKKRREKELEREYE